MRFARRNMPSQKEFSELLAKADEKVSASAANRSGFLERAMGIEPPSENMGNFQNCLEPLLQCRSGGGRPPEVDGQTFGPIPSPGTIFVYYSSG